MYLFIECRKGLFLPKIVVGFIVEIRVICNNITINVIIFKTIYSTCDQNIFLLIAIMLCILNGL